jgi:segregation and condensation protein B
MTNDEFEPPEVDEESIDEEPIDEEPIDSEPVDSEPVDESDDDFSFEQLSAAYAKVLKQRDGESTDQAPDAEQLDDAGNDDAGNDGDGFDEEDAPEQNATEGAGETDADVATRDNAASPISPKTIVESILFVGAPQGAKLTTRQIAAILRDVSPQEVSQIIKDLNQDYESENSAFRIVNEKGVVKMALEATLAPFQQSFFGRNKTVKLSQTAIDVLAVVAYNQPVSREEVDKIRGKSSGSIVTQLLRRELLSVVDSEAHPTKQKAKQRRFATTDKFLDFLGLTDLDDLPQSHEASEYSEFAD